MALSDKPVAVTNAAEDEARCLFMSNEFRQDRRALGSEGAPLWDGLATLSVRPASGQEASEFDNVETNESDGEDHQGGGHGQISTSTRLASAGHSGSSRAKRSAATARDKALMESQPKMAALCLK